MADFTIEAKRVKAGQSLTPLEQTIKNNVEDPKSFYFVGEEETNE